MAATEEDWERIFRQRLENYESEPAEDALERILKGAKPPSPAKPTGNFGRRFGWSVALLSILGMLSVGIWQYRTLPADELIKTSAVAQREAPNKAAQAPVLPESRLVVGRIASQAIPSANRISQRVISTGATGKSLPKRTAPDAGLPEVDEAFAFAGASEKRRQKSGLPESGPALTDRQDGNGPVDIEKENRTKEIATEPNEINFTITPQSEIQNRSVTEAVSAKPEQVFHFIAGKTTRFLFPATTLPAVHSPSNDQAPVIEPERLAARPSFFASVMPLYTFRQVTPTRQDEVVMEKIRPATSLSARTGWRVQAGAEWPLSRTLSLRVGAVYQRLQQQLTYSARALHSDSSKVEWVDQQTIKLTPLYKSEEHHVKSTWQYVALSAEGRLQLNPGQSTGLRHSIAAGGSVGYLISGRSKQRWQPFLQASYGIERRLTEKLRLQVEPGIVYNLTAINDNSRCFSVRPYSYGLVIGLHWQP